VLQRAVQLLGLAELVDPVDALQEEAVRDQSQRSSNRERDRDRRSVAAVAQLDEPRYALQLLDAGVEVVRDVLGVLGLELNRQLGVAVLLVAKLALGCVRLAPAVEGTVPKQVHDQCTALARVSVTCVSEATWSASLAEVVADCCASAFHSSRSLRSSVVTRLQS
jgi:hypothetical protein